MFNTYMCECGLKACVVSVSGGIDSAVTMALMSHAKRQENSPIEKVFSSNVSLSTIIMKLYRFWVSLNRYIPLIQFGKELFYWKNLDQLLQWIKLQSMMHLLKLLMKLFVFLFHSSCTMISKQIFLGWHCRK